MPSPDTPKLSPQVRGLPRSATLAINERCMQLRAQGRRIFQFGFGQSPFPVPESVVASLRDAAHEKAYLPGQGLPELRAAVAAYYARTEQLAFDANRIIIGPGSKELIFLLQLTLDAELLIPSPAWVSYAPQARMLGRSVQRLPTSLADGWRLTPETLDAACGGQRDDRQRLLILNYPGNPTGTSFTAGELDNLAAVARQHGLLILSDEIYSGLHFTGGHVSIARFYPQATIISNGLSKWCGAGGWRLGTFAMPAELDWLTEGIVAAASETFSAVSAPIQFAAVTAFSGRRDIDAYQRDCRAVLQALAQQVAHRLREFGAEVFDAEGGFYLLPVFQRVAGLSEAGLTAPDLCRRILESTGVAMLPGSDFGLPPDQLVARMALVDFDGAAALAALRAGRTPDNDFLRKYCHRVLDGVEHLGSWLKDRAPD